MIVPVLLVGGATFRRLLAPRHLVVAALGGALTGLVVLGLPAPTLAIDVYHGLVATLTAILVLPLVAGLPTADRAGGYEQLQGSRPISSLAWTLGRTLGSVVAGALLALIVAGIAGQIAGRREVPRQLTGLVDGEAGPQLAHWRFHVPKGEAGPYDLSLETFLPLAGSARLDIELRRGNGSDRRSVVVLPARRQTIALPDLAPERGDLYVTLRAHGALVLGRDPPLLAVGTERLGQGDALALRRGQLLRLGLALLVVLSAACAFHFETACLAGLLVLAVQLPTSAEAWLGIVALLLLFAVMGVALVRRQVLP